MTREEKSKAIDALKISAPIMAVTQEKFKDYIQTLNQVMDWLEQESRWIPVNERLPEDHKDVLVYLSSDRMSICRYNSHKLPCSNDPIGWGYIPGTGYIDFEKEHVIAWMSLPKAYKEVEE
jgi:hypothetical protein